MILDKHKALLEKLYDKTISGERRWTETFEPDVFQLSFPNYTVQIKSGMVVESRRDRHVEKLEILNEDGETIESFDADDIRQSDLDGNKTIELCKKFYDLYREARRQALGADEALEEILDNL